jgi:class 3 adenylate cyclase
VNEIPEIRYARSGDVALAYQVPGEGPFDLFFVPGFINSLEIRAGLHMGEVELIGDDLRGSAVHTGARVGALAGASEVLVSQTVKDLLAGSGLAFEDAGEHELRGAPDRWRLYRVVGG